ncbi:hypothetical protein [Thermogemmatispora onikobensis]|uniref:hypothetical protein n=1 Tax=Thermogemmatispora onikobensis TaxID=732234 RepID=UPI000852DCCC|nr:hypothetical protein [Thermogemmatispora onikobensis]
MQWMKGLFHRTATHPERSLRRLERQIAAYQARQMRLEATIQQLCAQHLALQLTWRRRQRHPAGAGQPARVSPGGRHALRD